MVVPQLLLSAVTKSNLAVRQWHACHSTSFGSMVRVELSQTSVLVDEVLRVVVSGLQLAQKVTVSALLEDAGKMYASHGQFTADPTGRVDLSRAPSHGGTYTGVSNMGLFWSMQPTPDMRKGTRLLKADVTTPLVTRLDVHSDHVTVPDPRCPPSPPLVSADVKRWYKSADVDRVLVRDGELFGTLFVPKGGPYPGVVDVFGSVGGVVEHRAALLASRGFVTFALSYISCKHTPPIQTNIDYYQKAVELLRRHPRVAGKGIGMIGTSKGSDVCLLTSIINPNVKAVVSIGGSPWIAGCQHEFNGSTIEPTGLTSIFKDGKLELIRLDGTYEVVNTEEGMTYKLHHEKASPESLIPIERTHAQLLILSGDDDPYVTDASTYMFAERLTKEGRGNKCTTLRYPGAGHLLEPPYTPHCRVGYYPVLGTYFVWGGNAREHAQAQEDSWTKIQEFFRENLSDQVPPHKL